MSSSRCDECHRTSWQTRLSLQIHSPQLCASSALTLSLFTFLQPSFAPRCLLYLILSFSPRYLIHFLVTLFTSSLYSLIPFCLIYHLTNLFAFSLPSLNPRYISYLFISYLSNSVLPNMSPHNLLYLIITFFNSLLLFVAPHCLFFFYLLATLFTSSFPSLTPSLHSHYLLYIINFSGSITTSKEVVS